MADPAEHPSGSAHPTKPLTGMTQAEVDRHDALWPDCSLSLLHEHPSGSPQTEAGRDLLSRCESGWKTWMDEPIRVNGMRRMILAIEAEAAARRGPLDVERLARAMAVSLDIYGWDLDIMARDIAAEYASLASIPTPERGSP